MCRNEILDLRHPLGRHAIDVLPQRNLVNIGIGDVPGRVVVAADNRRTHTVAFGDIEDRFLPEDLGSSVPDVCIKAIGLAPHFTGCIGSAPGGIRANSDLVMIDGRPAILRPALGSNDAILRELVGGR